MYVGFYKSSISLFEPIFLIKLFLFIKIVNLCFETGNKCLNVSNRIQFKPTWNKRGAFGDERYSKWIREVVGPNLFGRIAVEMSVLCPGWNSRIAASEEGGGSPPSPLSPLLFRGLGEIESKPPVMGDRGIRGESAKLSLNQYTVWYFWKL